MCRGVIETFVGGAIREPGGRNENPSGDLECMNIPGVHIERIRGLGYTESEARFLYIAAVFSGYFTLVQQAFSLAC
jgi:hypothetical protein